MIMVICYKDISCKNILLENQRTDWDICDYIHNMLYVKRATVRVLEFQLKPTSKCLSLCKDPCGKNAPLNLRRYCKKQKCFKTKDPDCES